MLTGNDTKQNSNGMSTTLADVCTGSGQFWPTNMMSTLANVCTGSGQFWPTYMMSTLANVCTG